jgi:hypothetical protein
MYSANSGISSFQMEAARQTEIILPNGTKLTHAVESILM